ncbi:MAG: hypothetical protein RIE53_02360 [Rhodothermales bacterium]
MISNRMDASARLSASLMVTMLVFAACGTPEPTPVPDADPADYLFVWAGDVDGAESDFLAVIDARADAPSYGDVVATLPVGAFLSEPHHTEYEFPVGDTLFANGWTTGQTFVMNLSNPLRPELVASVESVGGYWYPHAYARLPDGGVLATMQSAGPDYAPIGGLAEMGPRGDTRRVASAASAQLDSSLTWPYSLAVVPGLNRVVSTNSDMGRVPFNEWSYHYTYHVQTWSLDPLELVATVPLPESGTGEHHFAPNEPRVLADGTVYVNTFGCGLYRLDDVASRAPTATLVHTFPGGLEPGQECAVPVVVGDWYIQTVPALPGLIVLDVSNPLEPVEAFRYPMDTMPHWVAADRTSNRLVVTGMSMSRVDILTFDPNTGTIAPGGPSISFDRAEWPHGASGKAVVHGALFGTPRQ